jgi:ankyrin repeat protein
MPAGFPASSLLHLAAYSNSVDAARVLIDDGERVNSTNGAGETPLHVAARYNAWETADLLIARGARIHVPNQAGETPHDVAVDNGNLRLAELLRLAPEQPTGE